MIPPLAACTPSTSVEGTLLLLAAAVAYLLIAVFVLLKTQHATALVVLFLGGLALGAGLLGGALSGGDGLIDAGDVWLMLPALIIFAFCVRGGMLSANPRGRRAPLVRGAVAALLGIAFPAFALVLIGGLALTTGSTCLG